MNWSPIILTFKLAFISSTLLLLIGIPIAYWLSYNKKKYKAIFEALIALPLVLPPTVIGFYLLLAFSPNNVFGEMLQNTLNLQFVFSFEGLVLATVIYSLPFMVQPVQSGFFAISQLMIDSAKVLGKTKWQILWYVLLPNIKSSVLTGFVLSFAHSIGEFGVVLMIGGNIEKQTRVASIAIYDRVEALDYLAAHQYAIVLFIISFTILFLIYYNKMTPFKSVLK